MANPFSLEGKVALVTGGNTGLGQGIAVALAQAGADVAVAGIQPPTETIAAITSLGRRCLAIEANLISIEPVERVIRETIEGLADWISWSTTPVLSAAPTRWTSASRTGTT